MASEVNRLLDELQARIEKLRHSYEQYFMGIDKLEPVKEREEVARTVRRIQVKSVSNTALRFRLKSLQGRFLSYQNYWNRIVRQIENGTYARDLARIERDAKARGVDLNLTKARTKGELEAELMKALQAESAAEQAGMQPPPSPGAAQPPPPPGRGAAPPPPPPSGGADAGLRQLYDQYVAAKQQTGESTARLSFDKLKRTIEKQTPAIKQKTGASAVDYKVEIRDGKTVLRAVPKK